MWHNVREKRRLARFRNGPANQIGSQCVIERLPIDISLPCCGNYACHSSYFLRAALFAQLTNGTVFEVTALTPENAQNHHRSCLHKKSDIPSRKSPPPKVLDDFLVRSSDHVPHRARESGGSYLRV